MSEYVKYKPTKLLGICQNNFSKFIPNNRLSKSTYTLTGQVMRLFLDYDIEITLSNEIIALSLSIKGQVYVCVYNCFQK